MERFSSFGVAAKKKHAKKKMLEIKNATDRKRLVQLAAYDQVKRSCIRVHKRFKITSEIRDWKH